MKQLHPDAALPAVHVSDTLMTPRTCASGWVMTSSSPGWARRPRAMMAGRTLGAGWDLPATRPPSAHRPRILSGGVGVRTGEQLLQVLRRTADYIDLDRGLVVISEHAKSLGYDAVVLFLDELVLWLAFSVRDNEFFARESQKITKLVESSGRQPGDPVDLLHLPPDGLAQVVRRRRPPAQNRNALDRAFQYQQGRFRRSNSATTISPRSPTPDCFSPKTTRLCSIRRSPT